MEATLFAYPVTLTKGDDGRYLVRFPDVPEALTDGATEEEALREAADCLSEALMSRVADKEDIPLPSEVKRSQCQVAVDPTVALKVALYAVTREQGITAAELTRRLHVEHKEARRLLDPYHATKLPRLKDALAAVGYEVAVTVHDASRRDRLLTSPVARQRPRMSIKKAIKVNRSA
ncbi:MAG: type II toxin-antitoxin system HicB family antitoxin [Kiloniellaceae bacterium]